MLLKVFRENQAFTYLLLFLLAFALWLFSVLNLSYQPDILSLYNYFGFKIFPDIRLIDKNISLVSAINLLVVLITGFYLSNLSARHGLMATRSLVPMLAYFFTCLPWFVQYSGLSYTLLSNLLLLIVVDNLFRSAEKKGLAFSYFNNAFLLSVASFFNYTLIFYLIFLFFLFFRLRGNNWRELVFVLLGTFTPYLIAVEVLYLKGTNISELFGSLSVVFRYKIVFEFNWMFITNAIFLFVMFFIASGFTVNNYVKMKIITRKYSVSFFAFFVFTVLVVFFIPSISRDGIVLLSLPLAFLFGSYFAACRVNLINQLLFFLFILGNLGVFVFAMV